MRNILSLVDRQVAEDVLQETNLVLCKKADDFDPGTNFKAWAFRIAHLRVLLAFLYCTKEEFDANRCGL